MFFFFQDTSPSFTAPSMRICHSYNRLYMHTCVYTVWVARLSRNISAAISSKCLWYMCTCVLYSATRSTIVSATTMWQPCIYSKWWMNMECSTCTRWCFTVLSHDLFVLWICQAWQKNILHSSVWMAFLEAQRNWKRVMRKCKLCTVYSLWFTVTGFRAIQIKAIHLIFLNLLCVFFLIFTRGFIVM